MGRPKSSEAVKRDIQTKVMMTADERALIEDYAHGMGYSISEYIRWASLQKEMPQSTVEQQLKNSAILELNRIGVNLNQIAKQINSGKQTPALLEQVLLEIRQQIIFLTDRSENQ